MNTFVEQLLNGLTVGGIYALIALGYTMVYGIIKLINFAHGDIFMVGAFVGYFALTLIADVFIGSFAASLFSLEASALSSIKSFLYEYKFIIAVAASVIFCGALGWFIERVAYRPLRESSANVIIGSAAGLTFIVFLAVFVRENFSAGTMFLFLILLAFISVSSIALVRYVSNNVKVLRKEYSNPRFLLYILVYLIIFGVVFYLAWYYDMHMIVLFSLLFILLVYWLAVSRVKGNNSSGNSRINALISAIGMSMILSNLVILFHGTTPLSYKMDFFQGTIKLGSITIRELQIFIILFSFFLMGVLFFIINKTKFGLAMRAVSHNLKASRLMGINPDKVIATTFILGSALAGIAGVLVGTYYQTVKPDIAVLYGLKAFVAAVLGGIGSIPGAVVGGIVLGISEIMGVAFLSSSYRDAIAFGILILILIIKPTGIFGKNMKEKV